MRQQHTFTHPRYRDLLCRVAVVALCIASSACSNALRWEGSAASAVSATTGQSQAAAIAQSMIGAPYRWGGTQPDGFDCSGLVKYAYNKVGIAVPRTSLAQYRASQRMDLRSARVGDLVFFNFNKKVSHVGIYLGEGRFVHAPSSGNPVQVASLRQPPYSQHFVGAGRIN